MAIQDFLSGGFYGKVGDVVGQRWHNKRYVRAYVKGTNPNTPAQKQNRGMFAKATKLAQLAFNINKGNPSWDTTEKGEFSLRVGTAMKRLKAGMSDTDALPLYPDSFSPSHTLSDPAFTYISGTSTFRIYSNDAFNVQGRTFGVVIRCLNAFSNVWEDVEYTYSNSSTTNFDFSWTSDATHVYPAGTTFTAATTDDSTHANLSVLFPSFAFQQTVTPTLPATISWGTFSYEADFLDFHPLCNKTVLGHYEEIEGSIHIYSLFRNRWVDADFYIYLETDGTIASGIAIGTEYEARQGTYIAAGNYEINTSSAKIVISWPYKAFSWP